MIEKKIELAGRELKIETGTLAKQASGSVLVTMGETVVLVAVTANPGVAEDRGFSPIVSRLPREILCIRKNPRWIF